MRGLVNTRIKLRIMRKGADKPMELAITRDIIRVRSVRSRIEGGDVGYIRITQFNEQTTEGLILIDGDDRRNADGQWGARCGRETGRASSSATALIVTLPCWTIRPTMRG